MRFDEYATTVAFFYTPFFRGIWGRNAVLRKMPMGNAGGVSRRLLDLAPLGHGIAAKRLDEFCGRRPGALPCAT